MSPYNENTTAEEVASDCQSHIANKIILVTGVSPGGLGAIFATTIAKYGPAGIILATRDIKKAEETARDIAAISSAVRTWNIELDLASLAQIRQAADRINAIGVKIDVLVNNAGIMAVPYAKTADGIESQFGANHIGHFLLTNLIFQKALEENRTIRVVNVASNGFRFGHIRFGDYNFDDGKTYERWLAYAQSKSANMLFSKSIAHKLGKRGFVSVSLHPGVIQTNLGRHLSEEDIGDIARLDYVQGHTEFWGKPLQFIPPSLGVATHVFAAFHPSLDLPENNGRYLLGSHVEDPKNVYCWARDDINAERLWALSEKLVGEKFEY